MISFAGQLMVLVPVLIMAVGGLIAPGLVLAQAQTQDQNTEQMIRETQQSAHQYLTENEKQVNGIQFETRWGAVHAVQPGTLAALFADCAPGEYAVAEQHMFETREVTAPLSFSIANPDNTMSWLMVVYNADDDPLDASVAAVCASESGSDSNINLDYKTRATIQNVVNQVIVKSGTINFGQITNIYQNITQVANQYVNITGNNNTVTQIINQSASQIVASNGSNINQTIAQNAQQIAGISANATGGAAVPIGPGEGLGVNATGAEQNEEIQPEEQVPPAAGGGNVSQSQSNEQQQQPPGGGDDTIVVVPPPEDNEPQTGPSQQIQPQPPQQRVDEEPAAEEEEEDTATTPDDEGTAGDEDEAATTTEEDGGDGDGDGVDEEEEDGEGTDE